VGKRKKQKRREGLAEAPTSSALGAGLAALGFQAREATPQSAPDLPGAPQASFGPKVVVRRERKGRGGRTVTVVTGVRGDRAGFAKAMRKALGCGASVEGDTLVLQGDLTARARDYLASRGAKKVVVGN